MGSPRACHSDPAPARAPTRAARPRRSPRPAQVRPRPRSGLGRGGEPRAVLALVVLLPAARPRLGRPGHVGHVPVDRLANAALQRDLGAPAEPPELRAIHRVAAVVAAAVLDGPNERP